MNRKVAVRPLKQIRQLTTLTALLAMSGIASAADAALPAVRLLETKRPLVIGHRGYPQFAPENTVPSWKLALAAGADMAELDYYHSKDGVLVVMHDPTLDRTTDATNKWGGKRISVASKTMAELKTLDAGSWFDAKYAGTKVPTLNEALDTIQGGGGMTLIERKEGDAATCVKLVRDRSILNRVIVQAFDWQYLKAYHELEPEQVLGALGPPKVLPDGSKAGDRPKELNAAWLDLVKASGAKAAVWNQEVSKAAVKLAHERGLKVWVYTINDPELANKLLDMGVDGLITNNTSLIWRTIALRNVQ